MQKKKKTTKRKIENVNKDIYKNLYQKINF